MTDVIEVAPGPPARPPRRSGSRVWLGCLGLLAASIVIVGGAVGALVVFVGGGHWGSGLFSIDTGACDESDDALVRAAADGDVAKVRAELARQRQVDATDAHGNTALSCAVDAQSADVVRVLLAHGADPNQPGALPSGHLCVGVWHLLAGDTGAAGATGGDDCALPMQRAVSTGRTDVVTLLLDHGGDPTAALRAASVSDDAAVARLALERGADPNGGGASTTPLAYNTAFGNDQIVALLLAHGADPDKGGAASASGLGLVVAVLNGRGDTTPNTGLRRLSCTVRGNSPNLPPLVVAAAMGDATAVRALLAHHADPNATAGFVPRVSASTAARATGHRDIESILRAAGGRPAAALTGC